MKTLAEFIDDGMRRLGLESENQLAKALGYKSSGFLSQARSGVKGLPEEREDGWIRILRIPPDEWADFRAASARSRANQKDDVKDAYADLERRWHALRAAILPVVEALERGEKPSRQVLAVLRKALAGD